MFPLEKLTFKDLTLKSVMLLTLLTGQRAQTIHLLKVSDVNISNVDVRIVYSSLLKTTRPGFHLSDSIIHAFDSDDALCLVKTLTRYLLVSETLRHENCDELFIGTMKPFKGVSRDTVRRWIKTVMKNAGVDIQVFKPHSTRAASTSAAKQAGVQISDIMKCAGWTNAQTFSRFYDKIVSQQSNSSSNFSRSLLETV
ncbi:hypothetical protein FSP39_022968 [Pinctada imbricata]|uniref:Tyr recombinase domain-containing protein n=1 Tax=Pinctada imbricata TaxID=66713 RepID=A0AA89BRR0_PINIB|nr:hypothetical protein FSP39_022667 [Pinctada imbricata]KAK3105340.1 hypothetical protein FSP39_022968 [Pinctada imbricata]